VTGGGIFLRGDQRREKLLKEKVEVQISSAFLPAIDEGIIVVQARALR